MHCTSNPPTLFDSTIDVDTNFAVKVSGAARVCPDLKRTEGSDAIALSPSQKRSSSTPESEYSIDSGSDLIMQCEDDTRNSLSLLLEGRYLCKLWSLFCPSRRRFVLDMLLLGTLRLSLTLIILIDPPFTIFSSSSKSF